MVKPDNLKVKTVQTEIFQNGKIFNGGIRMQTNNFCLPHFLEIVVQTLLHSIDLTDSYILIGGDGRAYSKDLMERAVRVLAGNGVRKIVLTLHGWIPSSIAATILKEKHCSNALLFTGGHNHPGDDGYIGLKWISAPGIPVHEEVTKKANRIIQNLQSYSTCVKLSFNFDDMGKMENIISGRRCSIEVMDPLLPYIRVVQEMFDLPFIKEFIQKDFNLLLSCSNGVTGQYARYIFINELQVSELNIQDMNHMEDFGHTSPDPNPIACKFFLNHLMEGNYKFGAVINPDGCRCMIVGENGFVVTSSDSLAIVAAYSQCIPFFRDNKLETVYRSICTSQAVDSVADFRSLLLFEVPVGWQHFSTAILSADGKATLFGEESGALGVSSDNYCGDRDGIWTVLAWLSILAFTKKSVKEVVSEHWNTFGRSFFGRLDFSNVIPHQSLEMFLAFLKEKNSLRYEKIKSVKSARTEYFDPFGIDPSLQTEEAKKRNTEIIFDIENYVYPYGFIKKSLLKDDQYQVFQIHLMENARLVIRKSESSSNSSTLRFYIEHWVEPESDKIVEDREVILKPFIEVAMKITKVKHFIPTDINPNFI